MLLPPLEDCLGLFNVSSRGSLLRYKRMQETTHSMKVITGKHEFRTDSRMQSESCTGLLIARGTCVTTPAQEEHEERRTEPRSGDRVWFSAPVTGGPTWWRTSRAHTQQAEQVCESVWDHLHTICRKRWRRDDMNIDRCLVSSKQSWKVKMVLQVTCFQRLLL